MNDNCPMCGARRWACENPNNDSSPLPLLFGLTYADPAKLPKENG